MLKDCSSEQTMGGRGRGWGLGRGNAAPGCCCIPLPACHLLLPYFSLPFCTHDTNAPKSRSRLHAGTHVSVTGTSFLTHLMCGYPQPAASPGHLSPRPSCCHPISPGPHEYSIHRHTHPPRAPLPHRPPLMEPQQESPAKALSVGLGPAKPVTLSPHPPDLSLWAAQVVNSSGQPFPSAPRLPYPTESGGDPDNYLFIKYQAISPSIVLKISATEDGNEESCPGRLSVASFSSTWASLTRAGRETASSLWPSPALLRFAQSLGSLHASMRAATEGGAAVQGLQGARRSTNSKVGSRASGDTP